MRYGLLISFLVCLACIKLDAPLLCRSGDGDSAEHGPVMMQPPVTQNELDARCALRLEELRQDSPPPQPPRPFAPAHALAADDAAVESLALLWSCHSSMP